MHSAAKNIILEKLSSRFAPRHVTLNTSIKKGNHVRVTPPVRFLKCVYLREREPCTLCSLLHACHAHIVSVHKQLEHVFIFLSVVAVVFLVGSLWISLQRRMCLPLTYMFVSNR